jgi:hypothetical protein
MDMNRAVEALYATGHWLYDQGRFKDAADVFRAMARVVPEDERSWLGLGQAHEGVNQRLVAKEMYVTGITLAHSARCAIALSRVLREMGHEGASDALEYAREIAEAHDDEVLAALVHHEQRQS